MTSQTLAQVRLPISSAIIPHQVLPRLILALKFSRVLQLVLKPFLNVFDPKKPN